MVKNNLSVRSKTKKKKITSKTDYFLTGGIEYIDYKDFYILGKFTNRQGRIFKRSDKQLKSKTQRKVAIAIKRARQMALLPYTIVEQSE
jgi:small subunit ribosomal protein S18